jgi:hypothetical protein
VLLLSYALPRTRVDASRWREHSETAWRLCCRRLSYVASALPRTDGSNSPIINP